MSWGLRQASLTYFCYYLSFFITVLSVYGEEILPSTMWANVQRDGRPAEYRWRSVLNAAVWLTITTRVPCSNAVNIGERKTWTQSEFCTWQTSVTAQQPPKMYIVYQPRRRPNIVQSLVGFR